MRKLLSVLLLALVSASAHAEAPHVAIWCEFMPYRDVLAHIPVLERFHCDLLLHVERKDIGNADLAAVCREAKARGVTVKAWLLLPYDENLYVGEDTIDATRKLAFDVVDWSQREDLGVSWVVFDCEPSPLLGRRLFAAARGAKLVTLAEILKSETDPARFRKSVDALNGLIDDLHKRGVRVMGAGNRVILDFLREGNTAIQDSLNMPFSMIRWDLPSFITYRYHASQNGYVGMINRYAGLAREFCGTNAALDLGLIGDQRGFSEHRERAELFGGGKTFLSYLDGMRSTEDLRQVVSVAISRGVTHINLYSLEGAVSSVAGLDLWLVAASESRPAGAWDRWTPLVSLRMGLSAEAMDALHRRLVLRNLPAVEP